MQKLLDAFFYSRKRVVTFLAYVSLRLYGSEVTWRELWDQAFSSSEQAEYDLNKAQCLDLVLEAAKAALDAAEARRSAITDKCKTLLTVSSLLVAAVGILLPKGLGFHSSWARIIFFVAALALLNAVVLLLEFFNVRAAMVVAYRQADLELPPDGFKRTTIAAYYACRTDVDSRSDYLAEIYKGARFSFLTALTLIVLLFAGTFLRSSSDKDADLVAYRLRSDPYFMAAVRGDKGPKGDAGPKGERGATGSVDEDRIIQRLLQHSALRPVASPSPP